MIIGIVGKSRSGKSTVADMLHGKLGFPIMGVADPLKENCSQVFNIPLEDFYSAKKDLPCDINITEEEGDEFLKIIGLKSMKIRTKFSSLRDMLQYLGTDIVRKSYPYYWLDLLSKKENLIIADIRFKDEVEWVKSQQGILYYIDRADVPEDKHYSENQITSLDDFIMIPNNGTLEELHNKIDNLVVK